MPKVIERNEFSMLVSQIEYDGYFGKMLIGKIHSGKLSVKDVVQAVD
jgi:predicted membrane GTPase involved in stress response